MLYKTDRYKKTFKFVRNAVGSACENFLPLNIRVLLSDNYYGSGKLLLSSEYYVLDGAVALALPTRYGQNLNVSYFPSEHKVLHWKSYDSNGQLWFEAVFDIETFECLKEYVSKKSLILQKILKAARKLASGFLGGKEYVLVETYLEFPRLWGLGTSSTLIHNVAKWAGINPFELLFRTMGGSGYDIACAESDGPILYEKGTEGPTTKIVEFDPPFKDQLFFVYLGKKQSSAEGIKHYKQIQKIQKTKEKLVNKLSEITQKFIKVRILNEFEDLIRQHEEIIAETLKLKRVKELYFSDYWGEIKSLGAWGGDFVLVTGNRSREETEAYFKEKGYDVFISYDEMIRKRSQ